MRRRLPIPFLVLFAGLATLAVPAAGQAPELQPGPGPLAGTRIGEPEIFMQASAEMADEVPPIETRCFPWLDAGGEVLAWVTSATEVGGRALVRQCVDGPAPRTGLPGGVRRGGAAFEWETAALGAGGLVTAPLGLPDWSFFSNPAFCGSRVAYWAVQDGVLASQVYDLEARRVLVSQMRGRIDLRADAADTLDAPRWRADCAETRFRAARLGSRELVIAIP
jgi:hypothetical protein